MSFWCMVFLTLYRVLHSFRAELRVLGVQGGAASPCVPWAYRKASAAGADREFFMKTYRNLYPQVYDFENLYVSYRAARRARRSCADDEHYVRINSWTSTRCAGEGRAK